MTRIGHEVVGSSPAAGLHARAAPKEFRGSGIALLLWNLRMEFSEFANTVVAQYNDAAGNRSLAPQNASAFGQLPPCFSDQLRSNTREEFRNADYLI
jgi:hypothetical protein